MAQQTAIEWLAENIHLIHSLTWNDVIKQAKQMEKEQIVYAHLIGLISPLETEATKQAEEYYNESYGK